MVRVFGTLKTTISGTSSTAMQRRPHCQTDSEAYRTAIETKKLRYHGFSEVPNHYNILSYLLELANLLVFGASPKVIRQIDCRGGRTADWILSLHMTYHYKMSLGRKRLCRPCAEMVAKFYVPFLTKWRAWKPCCIYHFISLMLKKRKTKMKAGG
ncbi:hypothetical protein DVH24_020843 [Malus domestica]|uniref:Uncharacterized protein n=1 Tax=Malus domestica TaxID=3750 RepID=A0A498J8L9_MALDO|nr:hypothetical protein DVH24_020843 [Malus domestica]